MARALPARHAAMRVGWRAWIAIGATSAVCLAAFTWPLFASATSSAVAHASDAAWLFAVLVPLLLVVVLSSLHDDAQSFGTTAKAIALLGVLSAVIAALRPLGGGIAGLEPIWAILIIGARALGPGFGFTLGATSLFASALTTGGVGPWLPFQMIAAAWVGLGAGLLPPLRGRSEIIALAGYGAVASLAYGLVMNLWFWPFTSGLPAQIAYIPGASSATNIEGWLRFTLVTSLGWDLSRAILTAVLIAVAGTPLLVALRRVARRASFSATSATSATSAIAATGASADADADADADAEHERAAR